MCGNYGSFRCYVDTFGYSLSFGGNHAGIIGDFRWFGLNGVGMEAGPYADSIPHLVFCAFQMMFAMITPALITGSLVGRMKFKALFLLWQSGLLLFTTQWLIWYGEMAAFLRQSVL